MSNSEPRKLLIRGGTILSMDPEIGDLPRGDIVVEGTLLRAVEEHVETEADEVIDATGCIIIPGFVDTHRHMWEAVLRGFAPHYTLDDYFGSLLCGKGPAITPRDVYLGNLISARGALESGVTAVQDISNIQDTPEHSDAAVQALRESGLRSVFAYGNSFHAMMAGVRRLPEDARRVRTELLADDDALVTMALDTEDADDGAELHNHTLARELGVHTTRHVGADHPVSRLAKLGLMLPGTTFIHGNGLDPDELGLIADSDSGLSISPAIEMMMGHGYPWVGQAVEAGLRVSLSVDVEVTAGGDMFAQMRAAYQAARYRELARSDVEAAVTVQKILHYATLSGAETLGLADRTGSLRPGKQADLVVLRADRPDVAPVVDPYSTVVLQMDRAHVDTVLVAGKQLKRAGKLLSDSTGLIGEATAAGRRLAVSHGRQ